MALLGPAQVHLPFETVGCLSAFAGPTRAKKGGDAAITPSAIVGPLSPPTPTLDTNTATTSPTTAFTPAPTSTLTGYY